MTLENPPIIAINQARQGGFSSVNLPAPLNAPVITQPWGLGWLNVRSQSSGATFDVRTVRGISGNGASASTPFEVKTGGISSGQHRWLLPINESRFLVVFAWDLTTSGSATGNTGHIWTRQTIGSTVSGIGRKGLILSNTSAAEIAVTENLADWLWPISGTRKSSSYYQSSPPPPNLNITQYKADVYDAADGAASGPRYNFESNSFPVLANSGGFYEDSPPDGGGDWRMDLSTGSGFAEAKVQAPIVGAADKGSVWFKNYDDWDAKPYQLQRFIDDEWQQWSAGVSLVESPAAVTPAWEWTDSFGNKQYDTEFLPCFSVPFSDRTEWFQTEFGMDVS